MAGELQAQRARWLPKTAAKVELRIGGATLAAKLDAVAAVLGAICEAHREEMTTRQWENLHRVAALLADTMMERAPRPCRPARTLDRR